MNIACIKDRYCMLKMNTNAMRSEILFEAVYYECYQTRYNAGET